MEITTLCAVAAVLRVDPNRSQFFQYDSVSVNCGQQGNSSDWRVKRNTSRYINGECLTPWDETNESLCVVDTVYPSDSGVYWCESAAGESRDAVSITVTAGPVILESPALPVMEGDDVTLSCREESFSSNITADFYQDGLLIRRSSTGIMNIHRVSKHDEGLYKCHISGVGESPVSRLTVRGCPDSPEPPLSHSLLPVVVSLSLVSLLLLLLLCIWKRHKGKVSLDVSYTDVIITQEVQPNRVTALDAAPTLYSDIKLGNSSTSVNVWM